MKFFVCVFFIVLTGSIGISQNYSYKIALVKYNGGGDWYANPTSLSNLISYCNDNLNTNIAPDYATVDIGSSEIFKYPFVHLTGHGNIILASSEVENLRNYLLAGGFLHISDNYGLDKYIRREIKKVFPDKDFVEIPFTHPIYHQKYEFINGLPKIHEHDKLAAQGFGIFIDERLVIFYDYQCDLGDGWEDLQVHNDPIQKHVDALKMGANIIQYVFSY